MLHVTNGDSAGSSIEASGIPGRVLPWRDVLHDGPVPGGISDVELDEVRARYIAEQGWAPYEEARAGLAERAVALAGALEGDGIVLWFEHDLYDQLQLLQLLAWLAERAGAADRVSLICIDRHPAVERFIGLGQLSPEQMAGLFPERAPVTPAQLELARAAWAAFRAPSPTAIEELIRADTSALPFLGAALRRHLEQFPSLPGGLSRSEWQALEVIGGGVHRFDRVFQATQELEEAPFLGDDSLLGYLAALAAGPRPLLKLDPPGGATRDRRPDAPLELHLTGWGEGVLRREADWIELRGGIDRWLGGVHLTGPRPAWRWNPETELLAAAGDPRPGD